MNHKFLFNDDFDAKALEPPPITYDDNDMEIACQEHFLKGFEEGRFQALQEIEASCRILLQKIQTSLSDVDHFQEQSQHTVAIVIEQTMQTILPHFCEKGALIEIQNIVQDVIKKVINVQHITITCTSDLVEPMEEYIQTLQAHTTMSVKGDQTYEKSSLCMEWKGGFIQRDEKKLCTELQHLLKNYKKEASHDHV